MQAISKFNMTALGAEASDKGERKFNVIGSFENQFLQPNTRIRAVIAWNACPAEPLSGPLAPAAVATDLDLFLYNHSTSKYVYASQSFDDSTEGFDVTVEDVALHVGRHVVAQPPVRSDPPIEDRRVSSGPHARKQIDGCIVEGSDLAPRHREQMKHRRPIGK